MAFYYGRQKEKCVQTDTDDSGKEKPYSGTFNLWSNEKVDDTDSEPGKIEGRIIHHTPGQTIELRFTALLLLTEFIIKIIVKKDGKPERSSILSNNYHGRTSFTEKI